jgi:hypothetical protein
VFLRNQRNIALGVRVNVSPRRQRLNSLGGLTRELLPGFLRVSLTRLFGNKVVTPGASPGVEGGISILCYPHPPRIGADEDARELCVTPRRE